MGLSVAKLMARIEPRERPKSPILSGITWGCSLRILNALCAQVDKKTLILKVKYDLYSHYMVHKNTNISKTTQLCTSFTQSQWIWILACTYSDQTGFRVDFFTVSPVDVWAYSIRFYVTPTNWHLSGVDGMSRHRSRSLTACCLPVF